MDSIDQIMDRIATVIPPGSVPRFEFRCDVIADETGKRRPGSAHYLIGYAVDGSSWALVGVGSTLDQAIRDAKSQSTGGVADTILIL